MGNSTSNCGAPSMFDNKTNVSTINQFIETVKIPESRLESRPEIESLTKSELENEIKNEIKPPIPSVIKSSTPTITPPNPANIPVDMKPLSGGYSMYRNNTNDPNFYEKPDINELNEILKQIGQMNGGGQNELMPIRERYNRYDVFKTIHKIEDNLQGGADGDVNNENENNKAMQHIKNLIFEQLKNLENSKQMGSGGCGCSPNGAPDNINTGGYIDSSSSSSSSSYSSVDSDIPNAPDSSSSTDSSSGEYGYKSKKKSRKQSKKSSKPKSKMFDSESSNFIVGSSQAGGSNDSSSSSSSEKEEDSSSSSSSSAGIKNSTSNGSGLNESDEGLSVFPFNSSDVNSISSRKNFRMLRRKI